MPLSATIFTFSTASHLLIILLPSLFSNIYSQDVAPSPYLSSQTCNLNSPGYICDVHSVISDIQRGTINKKLVQFNANNPCGQCLAVAIFRQIRSGISKSLAQTESKALAVSLASSKWGFPNCTHLAVLVVNTEQRFVWFQAGDGSKYCSAIGHLFSQNKAPFSSQNFGQGIEDIMDSYISGFAGIYKQPGDCRLDSYPCPPFGFSETPELMLTELTSLLPNPATNAQKCRISEAGFICDPEQVLTDQQRNELNKGLIDLAKASECNQCFVVTLLKSSKANLDDLKTFTRSAISGTGRWRPVSGRCEGLLMILVSVQDRFIWMKGNEETAFCSSLNKIYTNNLNSFRDGNVYNGIHGIIGDYLGNVEKSGSQKCADKCGEVQTGSRSSGGIGGGTGGKVLGVAKNFASKNKGLVIGLVVAALVILGCTLCCACVMCREKTKSALSGAMRSAPSMLGGLKKRGGASGGIATFNSGGEAGGTAQYNNGRGEAGGTWGESVNVNIRGGGGETGGTYGGGEKKSAKVGGGGGGSF